LIKTFAAQSAVAIENPRLFQDVEASLEDLRTAQDRLVQTEKLVSLGQLTAGIAHEIKNPLNFVNNFSGISVELIDELQHVLARVGDRPCLLTDSASTFEAVLLSWDCWPVCSTTWVEQSPIGGCLLPRDNQGERRTTITMRMAPGIV
jgi:signal transduction histidine kinase